MDMMEKYNLLDKLLEFLASIENDLEDDKGLQYAKFRSVNNLSVDGFNRMLSYLENEGFIEKKEIKKGNVTYKIYKILQNEKTMLFEGFVNRQNAITQRERQIKATEDKAAMERKFGLILTGFLVASSIIAAVYYLIEILKEFHIFHPC
jgi:hypothetical protein